MNNNKIQGLALMLLLGLSGARAYGHGDACACPVGSGTSASPMGLSTIASSLLIVALTQPVTHLALKLYKLIGVIHEKYDHKGHKHMLFSTKGSLAVVGVVGAAYVACPRLWAALKNYRAKNATTHCEHQHSSR